MFGTITIQQVGNAVVGDEKSKPYTIIILFFALAYLYVSLDVTGFHLISFSDNSSGIFDWISIKALKTTSGSGTKVFFVVVCLSSCLTIVTSNDIVILTVTPIVCAIATLTKVKKKIQPANLQLNPLPFLVTEFFLANIWSMLLVIGNPTNIIVADAFDITFVQYKKPKKKT